ncbi:MAG: hypothetical protein ABI921_05240 [Panacibacter sp.]
MESQIRIRAFRAIDDYETCLKFYEGHKKVLENHGIFKLTTSNLSWAYSNSVFVVVVESADGSKLFGGARLHIADGISPLPIQEATSSFDSNIHKVVNKYAMNGTGEICGLWNSVEVAGYGIGSIFSIRASTVIAEQIGIDSLFFLCSPVTVRFNKWIGSRVITEVGNNGTFYYPKLDLLATAVILEDATELRNAHPRERSKIMFMRKHLDAINEEKSPFKNITMQVQYDLTLPNANKNEFKQVAYNHVEAI